MPFKHNKPMMPLGAHPQSLNLLPWRTQYIHYRWLTLRRWALALAAVFFLWMIGLMVLTQLYHQHLDIQQRQLTNIQQQALTRHQQRQMQHNQGIGQYWLQKQTAMAALVQSQQQQHWLSMALRTLQHHAASVDGSIHTWQLTPTESQFTIATAQPWQKINQHLQLPDGLHIKTMLTEAATDAVQIHISSASKP